MSWTAPEVTRTDPPFVNGERESLEAWLEYHRQTLLWKCQGLTAEQLCQRAVSPSTMSLLGLVRHMAEVERGWFRRMVGEQEEIGLRFCSEEMPDADFAQAEPGGAEAGFAAFAEECAAARAAAAGKPLGQVFGHRRGAEIDLRWVYTHMIEEYARHNGHADILREQIDGVTGD